MDIDVSNHYLGTNTAACWHSWWALRWYVGDVAVIWQQSMLSLFSPKSGTTQSRSQWLCHSLTSSSSLSLSLTPTCWIVMPAHTRTHTPCSIDLLPEDTRSSHMVSIFKTGLSNGDLYYNLTNMGACSAQRLSWHREILLKERGGIHTHTQTTHAHACTRYPSSCRKLLKYTRKLMKKGMLQHVALALWEWTSGRLI